MKLCDECLKQGIFKKATRHRGTNDYCNHHYHFTDVVEE